MRLSSVAVFILAIACSAFGQTYTIKTVAGGGLPVNIFGTSALLGDVRGVATDRNGNVFMALGLRNSVVRWDATTGVLTLVAGNGTRKSGPFPEFGGSGGGPGVIDSAATATPWGSHNCALVAGAAYDIKKLRGKGMVRKIGTSRRYAPEPDGLRAMTALVVVREKVIRPWLAASQRPESPTKPNHPTPVDQHHEHLRVDMRTLFTALGIAA